MRHRSPVLAAGLLVGLMVLTAGSAQAQQDMNHKKVDAKTLQKQCATLASSNAKDNSSMAAPAPTVSDSVRQLCDSVKAAKLDKDKTKDNYPARTKPATDSMKPATPAVPQGANSPASSATPASAATPATPVVPQGANSPASSATPADPATPATPADPNKPKADATSPQ